MRNGRGGGRTRGATHRSRWKDEDAKNIIQLSRDAGRETVVKGGIARSSFGSEGPGNDDDTLWVWDDQDLLPNGSVMVSARKSTFDSRWPYTGRRGWRPTSNKVAEAGFHFTPTEEEEDGCACIYCGVELSGWERTDDPVHEHQRRRPNCPFFHCILADALGANTSKDDTSTSKHENDHDDSSDYEMSHQRKKRSTSRNASVTHTEVSRDKHIPSVEPEHDTNGLAKSASCRPNSVGHARAEDTKIKLKSVQHSTSRTHPSSSDPESEPEPEPEAEPDPELEAEAEPKKEREQVPASTVLLRRTPSVGPESDDEATVERMVTSSAPDPMGLSLPHIRDYLPIPFPHRHSQVPMPPPVSDARKVTVLEWIQQQQNYLLDTMRERTEQQLTAVRQRNSEERKRLEKTLRS